MGSPWTMPHADTDGLASANPGFQHRDVPMFIVGAFDGTNVQRTRTPNIFKSQAAVSVNAETTVWTPAAGKKFRWLGYQLMGDVTGAYTFKDNTGGTTIMTIAMTANVALPQTLFGVQGLLSAAANNVLTCTGPGGSHITGVLFGIEE